MPEGKLCNGPHCTAVGAPHIKPDDLTTIHAP